ncbi:MAG: hypothetical protein FWF49_03795 [Oscillospiraceae bacterium]|nr:hypothetical protein [Oscillospiraceae bacterium]
MGLTVDDLSVGVATSTLSVGNIEYYLQLYAGIAFSSVTTGFGSGDIFTYLEKDQLYYFRISDTNYAAIVISGGQVNADGTYTVHYKFDGDTDNTRNFTVTLRPVIKGYDTVYQFISNVAD